MMLGYGRELKRGCWVHFSALNCSDIWSQELNLRCIMSLRGIRSFCKTMLLNFWQFKDWTVNLCFRFDMHDSQFFSQSVRISIASYILERTRFTGILDVSNLSRNVVGIEKLLQDKVFRAAFPLHDVSIRL